MCVLSHHPVVVPLNIPECIAWREIAYINLISQCEDMLMECSGPKPGIEDLIDTIKAYETDMENFALRHQRYAVLGVSIQDAEDLFQIANHYLDETPEVHTRLSRALTNNLYQLDIFIAEADTMIAKDKLRVNLGSHDAYGIDTVLTDCGNDECGDRVEVTRDGLEEWVFTGT